MSKIANVERTIEDNFEVQNWQDMLAYTCHTIFKRTQKQLGQPLVKLRWLLKYFWLIKWKHNTLRYSKAFPNHFVLVIEVQSRSDNLAIPLPLKDLMLLDQRMFNNAVRLQWEHGNFYRKYRYPLTKVTLKKRVLLQVLLVRIFSHGAITTTELNPAEPIRCGK